MSETPAAANRPPIADQGMEAPAPLPPRDLGVFYSGEVIKLRETQQSGASSRSRIHKRIKALEEKKAEEGEPKSRTEKEIKPPRFTFADRIRRQRLLLEARRQGVSDLHGFEALVDYFESKLIVPEKKTIRVPKGLNIDQRRAALEKWKKRGFEADLNDFHPGYNGKYDSLNASRDLPFKLNSGDVKLLKLLLGEGTNVIGITQKLEGMGLQLRPDILRSPEKMQKLAELYQSPKAVRAMDYTQAMTKSDRMWFSRDRDGNWIDRGELDSLIRFAKTPTPEAYIPPERMKQINQLCKALNLTIGKNTIEDLNTIVESPKYLAFVVGYVMPERGGSSNYYAREIPILERMRSLENAGLLDPLVKFAEAGIIIKNSDINSLFHSYEAYHMSGETIQRHIKNLAEYIGTEQAQSFLTDQGKQDFYGLLYQSTGIKTEIGNIPDTERRFPDQEKRAQALLIAGIFHDPDRPADWHYNPLRIDEITGVIKRPELVKVFTDPNFELFTKKLTGEGIKYSHFDLYFDGRSRLVEAFNGPFRNAIRNKITVDVIKALHPGGQMDFYKADEYISYAAIPNVMEAITTLRTLGVTLAAGGSTLPGVELLTSIAGNPSLREKLNSDEARALSKTLKEKFHWNFGIYEMNNFVNLFNDRELQRTILDPANIDLINKMKGYYFDIKRMKTLCDQPADIKALMVRLADNFGYQAAFTYEGNLIRNELDGLLANPEQQSRLFTGKIIELVKVLRKDSHYGFELKDGPVLLAAPDHFAAFVAALKEKYQYVVENKHLESLVKISTKKGEFEGLMDQLQHLGYQFRAEDLKDLALLMPHKDKIIGLVSLLGSTMGVKFNIKEAPVYAAITPLDLTAQKIQRFKELYGKYSNSQKATLTIQWIPSVNLLDQNEAYVQKLTTYNYKFDLFDIRNMHALLEYPQKEKVFAVFDIIASKFNFRFNPHLTSDYIKLAEIPNIESVISGVTESTGSSIFSSKPSLQFFTSINGDLPLFSELEASLPPLFREQYVGFLNTVLEVRPDFVSSVDFRLLAQAQRTAPALVMTMMRESNEPLRTLIFFKWDKLVADQSDLEFLNQITVIFPDATPELINEYVGKLESGELTRNQKGEFMNQYRIFSQTQTSYSPERKLQIEATMNSNLGRAYADLIPDTVERNRMLVDLACYMGRGEARKINFIVEKIREGISRSNLADLHKYLRWLPETAISPADDVFALSLKYQDSLRKIDEGFGKTFSSALNAIRSPRDFAQLNSRLTSISARFNLPVRELRFSGGTMQLPEEFIKAFGQKRRQEQDAELIPELTRYVVEKVVSKSTAYTVEDLVYSQIGDTEDQTGRRRGRYSAEVLFEAMEDNIEASLRTWDAAIRYQSQNPASPVFIIANERTGPADLAAEYLPDEFAAKYGVSQGVNYEKFYEWFGGNQEAIESLYERHKEGENVLAAVPPEVLGYLGMSGDRKIVPVYRLKVPSSLDAATEEPEGIETVLNFLKFTSIVGGRTMFMDESTRSAPRSIECLYNVLNRRTDNLGGVTIKLFGKINGTTAQGGTILEEKIMEGSHLEIALIDPWTSSQKPVNDDSAGFVPEISGAGVVEVIQPPFTSVSPFGINNVQEFWKQLISGEVASRFETFTSSTDFVAQDLEAPRRKEVVLPTEIMTQEQLKDRSFSQNYKALVIDLDGTTGLRGVYHPKVIESIKELSGGGTDVVIATARSQIDNSDYSGSVTTLIEHLGELSAIQRAHIYLGTENCAVIAGIDSLDNPVIKHSLSPETTAKLDDILKSSFPELRTYQETGTMVIRGFHIRDRAEVVNRLQEEIDNASRLEGADLGVKIEADSARSIHIRVKASSKRNALDWLESRGMSLDQIAKIGDSPEGNDRAMFLGLGSFNVGSGREGTLWTIHMSDAGGGPEETARLLEKLNFTAS